MSRFVVRPLADFSEADPDINEVAGSHGYLFVRNGAGFAGVGEAARLPIDEAVRWLEASSVAGSADFDCAGPIALGWHPFDGVAGEAVIPRVIVGKKAGHPTWVCYVEHHEDAVEEALRPSVSHITAPARYAISPGVGVDHYLRAVEAARDAVRSGVITKAVIARDIVITSSEAIDIATLLRRLRTSFGSSYRYSLDGFVGASPELLVERRGDSVSSHPLAGTTPRTGDPDTDSRLASELRASEKNQIEHRVVIDMVHDTLLPWCSYLDWQPEPEVVPVANVQHLGTRVEGTLSQPLPHVLELVKALSPTPALGGHPRKEAIDLITRVEGMQRGRYGGAVGWFDREGNGTWAVAIRCAEFSNDRRTARLFAGGGIVAESDPQAELAETQAKFQAMLAAIVRP